ncbi:DUF2514 domain-containing protein [Cupriavidus respiraculi]|uniref:DUF2514 family protein n=1 Tax=Cupriavidus respiraculi TaxID=195930 RepID=UPI001C985406|nr:DUF2514 family protein [Cupriavidus respiraculi]MBY4946989.1 DUF2514 domain-containing protein [Cupriavidus respiraculi]
MTFLDPRVWLAALLLALTALCGGYLKGRVDGSQKERAAQQAATLAAVQAARLEEQRRTNEQARIANEAAKEREQARADARASAAAADRLRKRVAELVASNSAAPTGGASTDDPIGMLADVLTRADRRAELLAEYADAARIAGQACERAYDSLSR